MSMKFLLVLNVFLLSITRGRCRIGRVPIDEKAILSPSSSTESSMKFVETRRTMTTFTCAKKKSLFVGSDEWCALNRRCQVVNNKESCETGDRKFICQYDTHKGCRSKRVVTMEGGGQSWDFCPTADVMRPDQSGTFETIRVNLCAYAYDAGFEGGYHNNNYNEIVAEELTRPFNPWGIFKNRPKSMLPTFIPVKARSGERHAVPGLGLRVTRLHAPSGGSKQTLDLDDIDDKTVGGVIHEIFKTFLDAIVAGQWNGERTHPMVKFVDTSDDDEVDMMKTLTKNCACGAFEYKAENCDKDLHFREFIIKPGDETVIKKSWLDAQGLGPRDIFARQPFMLYQVGQILGYLQKIANVKTEVETFRLHKFPLRVGFRLDPKPAPYCQQAVQSFHIGTFAAIRRRNPHAPPCPSRVLKTHCVSTLSFRSHRQHVSYRRCSSSFEMRRCIAQRCTRHQRCKAQVRGAIRWGRSLCLGRGCE